VKLAVNGWRIHGKLTGVGRYLFNVVRHWTAEAVDGRFDEVNFYTPKPINRWETPLPSNIQERVIGPDWRMLAWENLRLGPAAAADVLFCPSYSIPLRRRGRTVVTTHEATLALYPEMYPRVARMFNARLYGWSARHATRVITHTEAARQDIARAYRVPLAKIRVVPMAPADIFRPLLGDPRVAEARHRYLASSAPFFLFVGKLTARRNVPKLMEAFAHLKRTTALPHKLVVIGLNTTNLDLAALAGTLGIATHFSYVPYVSDDDLSLLYNAAEAFIMPYTYESVSLTALEAQACGTAVIIGDTPGLRETTGGAAALLPKAEVEEIAEGMARVASDPTLRRELADKGLKHARQFSWQRSAAETLSVLHEVAQLPRPVRVSGLTERSHLGR